LTLRVKCTGGGSDEALGLDQYGLGAGASHAGFDGRPLDAITFADYNRFLAS
jgi:hypothetical protein